MYSYYVRIKSYISDAVQRINYVQVNNSLLLKVLVVECFVLICIISCILFHMENVEKENRETVHGQTNVLLLEFENDNKTIQVSRQAKNTDDSEHEKKNNETSYLLEEKRLRRIRRDESKSKRTQKDDIRRHKKHRRNRRPKTDGILVARFNGALPDLHNEVLIGPWMKSTEINSKFDFTTFHLVEEKKTIEVNKSGLYMIIVQIAYTGNSAPNSYWIIVSSEGNSVDRKIAKCSTNSTDSTCITNTALYLKTKDRIRIEQQEKNRAHPDKEKFSASEQ